MPNKNYSLIAFIAIIHSDEIKYTLCYSPGIPRGKYAVHVCLSYVRMSYNV